jgi:hypothetical protein
MPLTYVIDHENKIVLSTGSGVLTTNDVMEHQTKLRDDKDFQPRFSQLLDTSSVTSFAIDTAMIRNFAGAKIFDRKARRAAVATTAIAVGLLRMLQAYGDIAEAYQVRIFDNRDEALNWLAEK